MAGGGPSDWRDDPLSGEPLPLDKQVHGLRTKVAMATQMSQGIASKCKALMMREEKAQALAAA